MSQAQYDARAGEVTERANPLPNTSTASLASPGTEKLHAGHFRELVFHLVKREIDATHRMTVLGWAWPVARQLAQLAVLVFIFGSVLHIGVKNFPVFVFSGLIAWTWFASGIGAATGSLIAQRHLLFQPRLPPAVLPIVSIVVPLVDVLMALPILVVMLLVSEGLPWTIVFVPLLILIQLVLMAGVAWLTAAGSVFFRDIPNLVIVGLTVMFYLTPVFYGLHSVPQKYAEVLKLNPMATIVDSYRALLLGQPYPGGWAIAYTVIFSLALTVVGYFVFKRLEHRFVDSL
jgi:lipopolysaccharide transport system permease protein